MCKCVSVSVCLQMIESFLFRYVVRDVQYYCTALILFTLFIQKVSSTVRFDPSDICRNRNYMNMFTDEYSYLIYCAVVKSNKYTLLTVHSFSMHWFAQPEYCPLF